MTQIDESIRGDGGDTSTAECSNLIERKNVEVQDGCGYKGMYSGFCYLSKNGVAVEKKASNGRINDYGDDDDDDDDNVIEESNIDDDELLMHIPDGEGMIEYYDHPAVISYSGTWKDSKWEGVGETIMNNGDKYKGGYQCFGSGSGSDNRNNRNGRSGKKKGARQSEPERHGFGTYTWKDQRIYTGNFENNLRHGKGCYTWSDGAVHDGNFVKGTPSGYGKYSNSKESYTGEWLNGQYHGYGVLQVFVKRKLNFDDDGNKDTELRTYRGHFEYGKREGYGVQTKHDGSIINDGYWEQDQFIPAAIGTFSSQNSDQAAAAASATTFGFDTFAFNIHNHTNGLIVVENELVTDASGIQGMYRGILHAKTRLPHGNGTLVVEPDDTQRKNQLQTEKSKLDPNSKGGGATTKQVNTIKYYEGFYEMGHQHGKGRLYWTNGDKYDGDFVYGKRSGYGIYHWNTIYTYSSYYKGQFYNNLRYGKGKLVLYNQKTKSTYEGSFYEGKRSGYGKLKDASVSYEGRWNCGVYHGSGILIHRDGTKYRGHFQNGLQHGHGKSTNGTGNIYEGEWSHGKTIDAYNKLNVAEKLKLRQLGSVSSRSISMSRRARGRSTNNNTGSSSLQRENVDDEPCETVVDKAVKDSKSNSGQYTGIVLILTQQPHGVGRMLYSSGHLIYEGFWKHGIKHGHGRCIFLDKGDYHEGEYVENLRNGTGKYVWKDGRKYMGNYHNDLRHGKGLLTYPNGDKYDGLFYNGERSGFGRFDFGGTNNKNNINNRYVGNNINGYYEGQFKKGKYHGVGRLEMNGIIREGVFKDGIYVKGSDIITQKNKDIRELKYKEDTIDEELSDNQHEDINSLVPSSTRGNDLLGSSISRGAGHKESSDFKTAQQLDDSIEIDDLCESWRRRDLRSEEAKKNRTNGHSHVNSSADSLLGQSPFRQEYAEKLNSNNENRQKLPYDTKTHNSDANDDVGVLDKKMLAYAIKESDTDDFDRERDDLAYSMREIGKEEGIAEGADKKAEEIAKNMLEKNLDCDLISTITGLSKDNVLKLKNNL